jgi:hypothetical protein
MLNGNIINVHKLRLGVFMENKKALAATRHGMSRTRPYGIWNSMRRRCNNPDARLARWYTGVTYDPLWDKFENFWADMQDGYADRLTLDRIDSSKGYRKENCRWADMKEQSRNRSSNIWLDYQGQKLCVTDYAKAIGLPRALIYKRLETGCAIENLTKPSRKRSIFPKQLRGAV